jgi:hypothetical protein
VIDSVEVVARARRSACTRIEYARRIIPRSSASVSLVAALPTGCSFAHGMRTCLDLDHDVGGTPRAAGRDREGRDA